MKLIDSIKTMILYDRGVIDMVHVDISITLINNTACFHLSIHISMYQHIKKMKMDTQRRN